MLKQMLLLLFAAAAASIILPGGLYRGIVLTAAGIILIAGTLKALKGVTAK